MSRLTLIISTILLISGLTIKAQDLKKYDKGNYIKGKDSIYYRILFPENFNANKKYPILFFLHGRGESGQDNQKQLTHGAKLFLKDDFRKQFPAIIVFPQCAENSFWANVEFGMDAQGKRNFNFQKGGRPTKAMHALLGMIDNFMDKPFVDQKRVYVGGLSMGAMGTYELLRRKKKLFAAAFAICGGDHVANVQKYKNIPLWIFHGEKDDVVPVVLSTIISDQLKVLGKEPKLTLYPNANHNSWDAAFADPKLLPWLFSNQKQR
ncbi:prolyl oligopeptidase family serine peptidase [Pedobacter steynii]|uniref:Phospholipase n=1 Tax=Pedobacter steynii TaxID=430522 RepID=A0A1D7QEN2_9SPHI|nr:prolyl oligopeptidase family serine peptidase [Pedobacter steynii]AOM77127.1 phospholipase [Pedobacter steynii]